MVTVSRAISGRFQMSRAKTAEALKRSGVVVVMNAKHVKSAEHLVTTMWEVYRAGFVAEATMRIDLGIINEAMPELVKLRGAEAAEGRTFVLGVGSIICNADLDIAAKFGFDMLVGPANMVSGGTNPFERLSLIQREERFLAPGIFTPGELQALLENPEFTPDAFKIFPCDTHGPKGVKSLLAPFKRERHAGKLIMPTGGVNYETGPAYIDAILSNGFTPLLGMSAPLELVEKRNAPGEIDVILESLAAFAKTFLEKNGGKPFGAIK